VIKAPAVRRAELIDTAQRLFLAKGYERTTINDVIEATGLSKGAFYHHFAAKEDLLEAIVERFSHQALASAEAAIAAPGLDALGRLNALMAVSRQWKVAHMAELRAMLDSLMAPGNGLLFHRIVQAVFVVMAPMLTRLIEQGLAEGVFDTSDPALAAEVMLSLAEGRRAPILAAIEAAERGDASAAAALIMARIRGEEAILDRLLGLTPGAVRLIDSPAEAEALMSGWLG
jgi:AcrR family transcriptional regulator